MGGGDEEGGVVCLCVGKEASISVLVACCWPNVSVSRLPAEKEEHQQQLN